VNTGVEVSGKNPDGSWWQIVYPPGSTARAWIFAAFTRTENTENVPVVLTPVPPTATFTPTAAPTNTPSPTATLTPVPTVTQTPTPTALAPIVEFRATQTTVNPGECTTLQWRIEFVRAAFLNGGEFNNFGDYSVNLFEEFPGHPESRPLFDMAAVAIVKNPQLADSSTVPCPVLINNKWIMQPDNKRKIVIWENFNKEKIITDFYYTLDNYVPAERE